MKFIKTYEKYGIENPDKIKKHTKRGGGTLSVFRNIVDTQYNIGKNEFNKGIDKYKDILVELKKKFKNKVDVDTIEYLNQGVYGMAFSAGDKVIKITTNKEEAEVAKKLTKKKFKHCVQYYDVVFIEKYDLYAILMDKTKVLSRKEEAIIDNIVNITDTLEYNKKTGKYEQVPELVYSDQLSIKSILDEDELKRYKVSKRELIDYINYYMEMLDSLEKQNIPTDDLHAQNMGWIKNKLVHFDIMGDFSGKLKNIKKIKV